MQAPSKKSRTFKRTYYNDIQAIETFVESESTTNFKGFEALHNIVLDIDGELFCSHVQTEVGQMHDDLRRSFETSQRNDNKLTWNVKRKNLIYPGGK